jgi:hypothetical protein
MQQVGISLPGDNFIGLLAVGRSSSIFLPGNIAIDYFFFTPDDHHCDFFYKDNTVATSGKYRCSEQIFIL